MLVPNEQVVESIPLNCIVKPLEEPENMTNIILQALEITGQRGVINRGWGGLGNCASWGCWDNTAAGLKAACPTTIVPFFGDQPFWGQRVHAIGVGYWGLKVDVDVFCFLDLASNYEPPDSLAEWLEAGEQPVHIGFDSLVSLLQLSLFMFNIIFPVLSRSSFV
ncbi:unnamed protein product [Prunus armeniaca]